MCTNRVYQTGAALAFALKKSKETSRLAVILQQLGGLIVVEPRGVEPLSESTLTGNFSGRRRLFTFPYPDANRHAAGLGRVIVHGAGNSYRAHGRH